MILSSGRLRDEIKEELKVRFPDEEFRFYNKMKEAVQDLDQAEVLITYGEDLTEDLIQKAKSLKWIMVISAGLDKMPFKALEDKDILVTNARGIHKTPMAEYTISMMLQISRNAKELMNNQKQYKWTRKVPMTEISGQTIGVLGAGAIGSEVARLAKAFNMKTIGFNRSGRPVEHFDEIVDQEGIYKLYEESDFIVNVLPSTPLTKGFIGAKAFERMKPSAVLINIGRGTTVVESELIEALREKKIYHAALDVFEKEPLPEESPLWEMENVTVTPHLSGISPQYQDRAIEIFSDNLKLFRSNKLSDMINIIPYDRGY
ncbi:D-2-hydroxyacid dehydrogenase [Fictibacillus phosphorivorans]|uniref:D-2-hydroxyacid dehydrogenase n=1 Tax=Fictibacillus phosphorivorans TaxID=1221500 RepID=UPI00203B2F35|nr:D-2-hydroxyacid dehydrogenase [Fictibacillus phosphorivorans]MCM3719956.1 D-2-hydroxyacid dehydrogenase [Fictibacillus phosphorivorans]MCM3777687.1 D-2-hydroxyacid dehydrogenase [Fictibacillus phosphorivorans]